MATRMERRKERKIRKIQGFRSLLAEISAVLLVSLLIRSYVFSFTTVDGPSMQDTLFTSQVTAVDKLLYRLAPLRRGQIVICQYPNSKDYYIKRVIGLPGETLRIENGVVYIGNAPLEEPYLAHPSEQTLGPVDIPENSYFVMGDNRANSHDSRAEGPIEKGSISGHVVAVVFPFTQIKNIANASVVLAGQPKT